MFVLILIATGAIDFFVFCTRKMNNFQVAVVISTQPCSLALVRPIRSALILEATGP